LKHIRITIDDEEYNALLKLKGNVPWREFILRLVSLKESMLDIYISNAHLLKLLGSLIGEEYELIGEFVVQFPNYDSERKRRVILILKKYMDSTEKTELKSSATR